MKKKLVIFFFKLGFGLLFAFFLQVLILQQLGKHLNYSILISSYLVNFLLAFLIVAVISIYIDKLKSYIGFLFMFGSMLKFVVFFSWFYPIVKIDGNVSAVEFSFFFIPYIVGLIFETYELSKMLNKI